MTGSDTKPKSHEIVPDGIDLETIQDRQRAVSTGQRKACPFADCTEIDTDHGSLAISRYQSGLNEYDYVPDAEYRCTHCGRTFDEPATVEIDRGEGVMTDGGQTADPTAFESRLSNAAEQLQHGLEDDPPDEEWRRQAARELLDDLSNLCSESAGATDGESA